MKIVMIANGISAVHRPFLQTARAYGRAGHTVLLVTSDAARGLDELRTIRVPVFQKHNGSDLSVPFRFPEDQRDAISAFGPDVIVTCESYLLGHAAAVLAEEIDCPLVFRPLINTQFAADFAPGDSPSLQRLTAELQTEYCELADCIMVPGGGQRAELRHRGVGSPIQIAPPGVELTSMPDGDRAAGRDALKLPQDGLIVGCDGTCIDETGLRFLCQSLNSFLKSEPSARLLVIGDGESLERIRSGLPTRRYWNRLHCTGDLPECSDADVYASLDVYAHVSRVPTLPVGLLRAIAAGVPIVASDFDDFRELVPDDATVREIPRGRRRSFAGALRASATGNATRRIKAESVARLIDAFDVRTCADRDLGIYAEVARRGGRSKSLRRLQTVQQLIGREWRRWHRRRAKRPLRGAAGKSNLLSKVVSWWHRFRRWMSRREWSVRLLDVPVFEGADDEPGLIIIQVDGLSREQLEKALDHGRMPFLRALRTREFYSTHSMYSGQPSTTPAVLAELFYGVEQAVPAFGFRDHQTGEVVTMVQPAIAARVQDRLAATGEGLLRSGSAYCDIYCGGADDSSFCPATTGWHNFEDAGTWRRVLLVLMNVMSLMRTAALGLVEFVVAVTDFFRGIIKGRDFWYELWDIPRRVVVNVLLREVTAISVEADVTRGVPIVHANLLGYDENAHRRGPDALFAHFALRGIDQFIRRIWEAAHASRRRDYSVWIMSDHGQQRVIPFRRETGREVSDLVEEIHAGIAPPVVCEPAGRRPHSRQDPPEGIERSQWRRMRESPRPAGDDVNSTGPGAKPVTVAIGPLGYIYWPDRLTDADTDRLARRFVDEAKIPCVMAQLDDSVWAWTSDGRFRLPEQASKLLPDDHPYFDTVAADFAELCGHPDAGEFVISGWRNQGLPLSFVPENGAHGGPGPQETQGFVMLSPDAPSPRADEIPFRPKTLRRLARTYLKRNPAARVEHERRENRLRIATYNVHGCAGMDGRVSPRRIARVLAAAQPDVIALQELDFDRRRSGFADQARRIADNLEMEVHFHPTYRVEGGQYGNAILSRFPLRVVNAGSLPRVNDKHEPRGVLWVEVDLGGFPVQVLNTHFGMTGRERRLQVEHLTEAGWLDDAIAGGPVILCGDFNASPRSDVYRRLTRRLRDAQLCPEKPDPRGTWFSRFPIRRIDHIFLSEQWEVEAARVVRSRLSRVASDHFPLVVDLRLPLGAAVAEPLPEPAAVNGGD